MAESDTFTELSQSKAGLHCYFELTEPLDLTANRSKPYECYTVGRYFVTTGKSFGPVKPIRKITPEEAVRLLKMLGYPWNKITDKDAQKLSLLDGLPDDKILSGMFAASNGAEIKALYNGDISAYQDDASRADAGLLAHLAFWCQRNIEQMERMWLASPLGSRPKTKNRADYRKRSIANAVTHCSTVYTPPQKGESDTDIDDMGLLYSLKGKQKSYYKNTENLSRIISNHPELKGTFRLDAYRQVIERHVKGQWRTLEDYDAIEIQTRISVLFSDFANTKKDMVYDAILKVAKDNEIDSGADYLRALKWDKQPRLDDWLPSVCNTAKDEYHRTIGANWVKGMV